MRKLIGACNENGFVRDRFDGNPQVPFGVVRSLELYECDLYLQNNNSDFVAIRISVRYNNVRSFFL